MWKLDSEMGDGGKVFDRKKEDGGQDLDLTVFDRGDNRLWGCWGGESVFMTTRVRTSSDITPTHARIFA